MTRRLLSAFRRMDTDGRTLPVVLALWAAMAAILLGCIIVYGHDMPLSEDWDLVPALVGRQPDLLGWLWEANNQHRIPLQKAIYLALLKITGGDFKIGMFADLLMLAGLCLAMILTARRLRGGQTPAGRRLFPARAPSSRAYGKRDLGLGDPVCDLDGSGDLVAPDHYP